MVASMSHRLWDFAWLPKNRSNIVPTELSNVAFSKCILQLVPANLKH